MSRVKFNFLNYEYICLTTKRTTASIAKPKSNTKLSILKNAP